MGEHEGLDIRIEDGIMRLIKNNPESGYGISLTMWGALMEAVDRATRDPAIRAVVIDAGGSGFHHGAVMAAELQGSLEALSANDFRDLVERGQALGRAIAALPKPVVGIARAGGLGGGLELLLRADFIYTLDHARFSFPEVTLGFVAAWGGTQWGGRMMAFRSAQEMLLLGDKVSGLDAVRTGLVTRSFANADALDAHVETVLSRLEYCSPASFAQTKACLAATWDGPLEYGERIELEAEIGAMGTGDFRKAHSARVNGSAYNFYREAAVKGRIPSPA